MFDAFIYVYAVNIFQPVGQIYFRSLGGLVNVFEINFVFRQIINHHRFKLGAVNRLGQIILKSRVKVNLPCAADRVGGKRNNGRVDIQIAFKRFHTFKRFYTVNARHTMIKKNYVVNFLSDEFQTFIAAFSRINSNFRLLEQTFDNGQIHNGIIDNQNSCVGRGKFFFILFMLSEWVTEIFSKVTDRVRIDNLLREFKRKFRAFAVNTLDLQWTVHHIKQALSNVHTQARAFNRAVAFLFNAFKGAEKFFDVFGLNAYAGIFDADAK